MPSMVTAGELMVARAGSVTPAHFPDEEFDLYSIPAHDRGSSEITVGRAIGSAKQLVRPGDVLLSKIVPHIRRAWVVGPNRGHRMIASGEWIVFRDERLNTRYLRHVLLGDPFHVQFMSTVAGVGGSLLRARPAFVAKIQIPLPTLEDQRRIAAILDQADALRAKRLEALAHLDDLTQSIFSDVFGDPLAPESDPERQLLADILAVPLQNGAYYPAGDYADEGIEMVHMSDAFYGVVPRGALRRVGCSSADRRKYALDAGDLLVARRSLNHEGSAKPCMIPDSDETLIFESSLIRVTPDPARVTPLYLYHYLNNRQVREKYVFPVVTGTTISGINQKALAGVPVLVPSMGQQIAFGEQLAAVDRMKCKFELQQGELGALFESLQSRAFAGVL
jgi:type I restriction enzyme, S subunit